MHRRTLNRLVVLATVIAVTVAVATTLAAGGPRVRYAITPRLPVAQLVSIARMDEQGLSGSTFRNVSVIVTTKNAAEQATYPGASTPGPSDPRAYLVVIRGQLVCPACEGVIPRGSPPAKPPRGRFAYSIWVPNQGISDGGFTPHAPPGLSKLGRAITLPLRAPRVPAEETKVVPGVGIGAVMLGTPISTVSTEIGPAIGPGEWVLGSVRVLTNPVSSGSIRYVLIASGQATLDGYRLQDGYARLRRELVGWRPLHCRNGPYVLRQPAPGAEQTWLRFRGNNFESAYIGPVRAGRCQAPVS
ncbi:MAG: hypothetical protein ACYDHH_27000 [Solirubrobacteraceae bacterium]